MRHPEQCAVIDRVAQLHIIRRHNQMAVKEKIRIRLQSYDVQLIDAAAERKGFGKTKVD